MTENENVAAARRYLKAIEDGVTDGLNEFFASDIVQEEFPNRLLPDGARRDLAALIDSARRGQWVLLEQRFDVRNVVAAGTLVAMELIWTGKLAVPLGTLTAGERMRAQFAIFLEFRDGKIARQHNYDCFDRF
jgi:ketosteroid isomerase-like protein